MLFTDRSAPDYFKLVWLRWSDFQGRSRRSEFWWFQLFSFVIFLVLAAVQSALRVEPVLFMLYGLVSLVPSLALSFRRLHDTNRSAWWLLLNVVPFGGIVLIIFYCLEGDSGQNRFGPDPKGASVI